MTPDKDYADYLLDQHLGGEEEEEYCGKHTPEYQYLQHQLKNIDDCYKEKRKVENVERIAHDNFISELETRKAEDKLWLCIAYGIGLFIAGYGLYQFIRFIVEGFTLK